VALGFLIVPFGICKGFDFYIAIGNNFGAGINFRNVVGEKDY